MQTAGWVPGPSHPRDRDGAVVFQKYERPFLLPEGYWGAKFPPELRLAAAQAAGAGPALIDWETAVQRWQRLDRRQRNYGSMQVIEVHDSLGNVISEERSPERPAEFVNAPSRP